MEPEIPTHAQAPPAKPQLQSPPDPAAPSSQVFAAYSGPLEHHQLRWIFLGEQGLRAGWSVTLFSLLLMVFLYILAPAASFLIRQVLRVRPSHTAALSTIFNESIFVLCLLAAGAIVAFIEGRRLADFNLAGPRRLFHFVSGLGVGFIALSVLVGVMVQGGWLRFGPVALSGNQILKFAALWGLGFLLVGSAEEGGFRCYLQFTLARGMDFWWALAAIGAICLDLVLRTRSEGAWGVYTFSLLGLLPCLWLHLGKHADGRFWHAAWVSSTLFGFIHTGNNGENWIGIFAASAIGFVFCVSVRLTGSAWWAIGCHASWDWAETYFYGTADSGLVAQGHYLSTTPTGPALWSGGSNGPEGSLLVVPVIALLLLALMVLYGRRRPSSLPSQATHQIAT